MKLIYLLLVYFIFSSTLFSQLFEEVTDADNELASASAAPVNSYAGCAWIDYDNDGWLDMFWIQKGLYHNTSGTFKKNTEANLTTNSGIGTSWSDYNNDGFIDCFIAGGGTVGSLLYKNNGNGTFTNITSGPFTPATDLRAWACAWGDINNDSYTDIVLAAPFGFASIDDENKFLLNTGYGTFEKLDTILITQGTAPYTVPTWSDYDMDGDLDCFIGSGPANGTVATDYLYKNQFTETGANAYFTEITTSPIGTNLVDGQVWNWIDYDNDGDLDAYLTNYVGTSGGTGMANNLYRNDAGDYVKLTEADAGEIVSDKGLSLASVWEDFDNDGDLDCIVTNDGTHCEFYYNNNDGTFSSDATEYFVLTDGNYYGAAAGDYDRDGDVDLFLSGAGDAGSGSANGLYENTASENGNNWVNFNLKGIGNEPVYGTNRSAIGTKIKLKANINGIDVWQFREISAQNSFGSMNSLNAEFGLGNAGIIDSLITIWPTGEADTCVNIAVNNFYDINEIECPQLSEVAIQDHTPYFSFEIAPNPTTENLYLKIKITEANEYTIVIADMNGSYLDTLFSGYLHQGITIINYNSRKLASGIYICKLSSGKNNRSMSFEVIK